MKYVVFTTKHHDGFNMFDTKYSDYKITAPEVPFSSHPKSDVTKEIFSAFRAQGLWAGTYFSKPDWHSDLYWWKHFPPADRNPNYSIAKYPDRWKQFTEYTQTRSMNWFPIMESWIFSGQMAGGCSRCIKQ